MPEDIKSLKEMKGDVLSAAVLRCLRVIDKDRDHPRAIPKNMIQKVNAVTQMALRIKVSLYILTGPLIVNRKWVTNMS